MKSPFLLLALFFVVGLQAQFPSYLPTNGLIAWYPFNGNTLDESFNGNNGSVNGGIVLTEDRWNTANKAMQFDGIPLTYLDCGNDTILNIKNNQSLTISAWVFADSATIESGQDVISSKNSTAFTNVFGAYTLYLRYGVPQFTVSNQGGVPTWYETAVGTDTLEMGKWYFIAAVLDASANQMRIYVNDRLSAQTTWGGTIDSNPNGRFFIGSHFKSNFASQYMYNFGGKIDDVGLWNRALSNCELVDLFTAGRIAEVSQNGDLLIAAQQGASYQWLDCQQNFAPIAAETSAFFTPSQSGSYAVVVSLNGCADTSDCYTVALTGLENHQEEWGAPVRIVNLLGQESPMLPNTPLIFMYSNGRFKKQFIWKP